MDYGRGLLLGPFHDGIELSSFVFSSVDFPLGRAWSLRDTQGIEGYRPVFRCARGRRFMLFLLIEIVVD